MIDKDFIDHLEEQIHQTVQDALDLKETVVRTVRETVDGHRGPVPAQRPVPPRRPAPPKPYVYPGLSLIHILDLADQCMQRLGRPSKNKWNKENEIKRNYGELTSSQMRNLFALVTRLYNRVTIGGEITPADIGSIKVRMVYDAGRKADVQSFLQESGLLRGLDFIGTDKGRFLRYARYMEALVAYHYYYTDKKD